MGEDVQVNFPFSENTANDEITNMIKGYVQEIEELR